MATEELERVARAILEAEMDMPNGKRSVGYYLGVGFDALGNSPAEEYQRYEEFLTRMSQAAARAALTAIREPSEGMVDVGCTKYSELDSPDFLLVPQIYTAMIDKALGEE